MKKRTIFDENLYNYLNGIHPEQIENGDIPENLNNYLNIYQKVRFFRLKKH